MKTLNSRIARSPEWFAAYRAGQLCAYRDEWMERARERMGQGASGSAARCVEYARRWNRKAVSALRQLPAVGP